MISYSQREVFTERHLQLFDATKDIVSSLFDDNGMRCHEVARIIGELFNLPVTDGYYCAVHHSWIMLDRQTILDPYAVGRLPMVQLVHSNVAVSAQAKCYVPDDVHCLEVDQAAVAANVSRIQEFVSVGKLFTVSQYKELLEYAANLR